MSRNSVRVVLAFALLLLAAPAFAATQNAVVYGTVYDAPGNPMPGVTVTLDNPALGFSRSTITGSDGSYNFAEVPPAGGYRLTAIKDGRKLDIRAGITVNVGDERVILPPLKEQAPAEAAKGEVVEKKAEAQAVRNETVSTAASGVITGEQLRSLPLYNRNFLALGLITPSVHDTEASSVVRGASFSIAGNRPTSNNFLLDGADNVASSSNQAVPFQVNDAIQEFRVVSSTASAEFGRNAGGVVNVVTRRGGNAFHGSVFGYFGSDVLNADNPLSVYNGTTFDQAAAYAGPLTAPPILIGATGPFGPPVGGGPASYNEYVNTAANRGFCTDSITPATGPVACVSGGQGANNHFDPASILATNNRFKPSFDSKQFGVNAGGALVKDKLFVFASYEGTRIDNPNPIFERVPTTFDKTPNPLAGVPLTGTPTYSTAPGSDFALAQSVLALYPTSTVVAVPGVLEFFQGEAPNYTHVHNGLARLDWAPSSKSSFSLRYAIQSLDQLHDDTLPEQSQYPGNGAFRNALNQNLNLTFSRTISANLINEVRVGFNRFKVEETAQDAGFDATTIGLPNRQLMTFLLSGIDPMTSGASNFANSGTLFVGALAGWVDSFWLNGPAIFGTPIPMEPTLDGFFPFARMGAPLSAPGNRRDTTWFVTDNLSWSHGKHSIRLGGEYRRLNNRIFNGAFSRGYVVSGNIGEFTHDSETSNLIAFFLGGPSAFRAPSFDYALRQPAPYAGNLDSWAASAYAQDTIRVHPRVTINLGVRYDYFSIPWEKNNQLWNFDPRANGLVQQGGSSVLDPFGNVCNPAVSSYPYAALYELAVPVPGGAANGWSCAGLANNKMGTDDRNNFAPRVGLAWDVRGDAKTVVRFGYGLYYDQTPVNDIAQLMFNRPTPRVLDNPQAIYGQNFNAFGTFFGASTVCGGSLLAQCALGNSSLNPANIVAAATQGFQSASSPWAVYARDLQFSKTPYTQQISASIQQSLTSKLALELGYVGTTGRSLPAVYNAGFNNEFFCTNSAAVGACDNFSVFPIYTLTNRGQSSYKAGVVRLRGAEFHGLRINATYTISKSIDNASSAIFPQVPNTLLNQAIGFQFNGTASPTGFCLLTNGVFFGASITGGASCPATGGPLGGAGAANPAVTTTGAGQIFVTPYNIPQDPNNFTLNDHGRSDFDSLHRLVVDYTWDLPSFHKSKWLDHWQLSGIVIAQTGQPFTIFSNLGGEVNQRANAVGPVTVGQDPSGAIALTNLRIAGVDCVNTSGTLSNHIAVAPAGGFLFGAPFGGGVGTACTGNTGRNAFTGPGYFTMNFAIQKGFPIRGEGKMLTIRTEFYNLFNNTNYYNPISTLSVDGTSTNPDFGKIKSAHDPRQIQFGVRFSW